MKIVAAWNENTDSKPWDVLSAAKRIVLAARSLNQQITLRHPPHIRFPLLGQQ